MTKRVILSEGRRDTEFLDALLATHDREFDTARLDIENEPPDRVVDRETNRIARFDANWNDTDVLLKSEGGVQNLLAGFPRLLLDLRRRRGLELGLLVDLDGRGLDWLAADLDDRLTEIGGRPMNVRPVTETARHHYLVRRRYEFAVAGTPRCEFGVVAFREALEAVAGIDKADDSPDEMDRKARRLAADRRISEPALATLL